MLKRRNARIPLPLLCGDFDFPPFEPAHDPLELTYGPERCRGLELGHAEVDDEGGAVYHHAGLDLDVFEHDVPGSGVAVDHLLAKELDGPLNLFDHISGEPVFPQFFQGPAEDPFHGEDPVLGPFTQRLGDREPEVPGRHQVRILPGVVFELVVLGAHLDMSARRELVDDDAEVPFPDRGFPDVLQGVQDELEKFHGGSFRAQKKPIPEERGTGLDVQSEIG